MTAIDEARKAVGVIWVTPDPELPTRQQPIVDPDALANLIRVVERETKAAMPCYDGQCREELLARYGPDGEHGDGVGDELCPTCTARAEKEER